MDPFIKIADLLVKLVQGREARRHRFHSEITSRLYEMSKRTYDDFIKIMRETEQKIIADKPTSELVNKIADDRFATKSHRDHMRVLLETVDTSQMSQFEFAVYDLLRGDMQHTLKHLILRLKQDEAYLQSQLKRGTPPSEQVTVKDRQINTVRHALEVLEANWEAVNAAYKVQLKRYISS